MGRAFKEIQKDILETRAAIFLFKNSDFWFGLRDAEGWQTITPTLKIKKLDRQSQPLILVIRELSWAAGHTEIWRKECACRETGDLSVGLLGTEAAGAISRRRKIKLEMVTDCWRPDVSCERR